MICGIFHQGSGLGNQLHRYVATRVRAADLGVEFGMRYVPDGSGKVEGFKGKDFMPIEMGATFGDILPPFSMKVWQEKKVVENGVDIRGYDPEFNFIEDNTIIDGEFQDERYWKHRARGVNNWLHVEQLLMPGNVCVIGFRGGEFSVFPELFLPREYWDKAIAKMLEINPDMQFQVHTDDPKLAEQFFPDYQIIHNVGVNWRAMRFAKYAIIANSSFYILPRWLNGGLTIAPRHWARHNTGVWALPQNYYDRFTYI